MVSLSSAVDGAKPQRHGALRRLVEENGLSLTLAGLFLATLVGQVFAGQAAHNRELAEHGAAALGLGAYLTSGHFIEATFENWESEFLQMGMFVLLTVKLRQRGSAESKEFGETESDEDPRKHRTDPDAPWPVRRGGIVLKLYEYSLSIAFLVLFLAAFSLHALGGLSHVNDENLRHGQPLETLAGYVSGSQFWYESFQNWQSEFFSILAMIVLTIFLRQRGSPQSKPVAAPHDETGA